MELLFESRSNLSKFSGTLHFVQWQPEIHPEAIVHPDTFVDGAGVSAYGTVLKDSGKLRMWYQAVPQDWPGVVDSAAVAYAESQDGYHWTKPPLGLVEHGPGTNHLCDLGLHSPSIFVDPDSPSSHRYRATGYGKREGGSFLVRPSLRSGYYTAHSADGLHWEVDSREPRWEDGDVITSIYHPGRECGITALKKRPRVNRIRRRSIHTAKYHKGEYSDHVSALYPDEYDDIAAVQRGHFSTDYYGMSMMPAGESTVGFLCNFRHDLPYADRPYATHGHSDITVVFQEREGDRWLHFPGRPNFISHRDLSWSNGGWISSMSSPIEMGDEHWLYFGGRNYEHGMDIQPPERQTQWIKEQSVSGITLARWPKYRLFGFETPREASFNIRLDNARAPFELHLNYKARKGGRVLVSVDGDERYTKEKCNDLSGDEIATPVSWKTGPTLHPPENGRVLLTIHLEMAAVYAYKTTPVQ